MHGLRLALLPLDDRPCNLLFPRRIAQIAGARLLSPPRRLMGNFTKPADTGALAQWLLSAAPEVDGLIVSADMLAYGGLVASRTGAAAQRDALSRLSALSRFRKQHRSLPIFCFSVIMRLGITVDSERNAVLHERIRRWAQLTDDVRRLGRRDLGDELLRLEALLPARLRSSYMRVRRRNHAVNMLAAHLVADGAIDYLVLAQEDAAVSGVHRFEQQLLSDAIAGLGVGARVSLHPGTDEAAMTLLARHLSGAAGRTPAVFPRYPGKRAAQIIPLYEDRPLRETVAGQVRAAGARLAGSHQEADLTLVVHAPPRRQREVRDAAGHPTPQRALEATVAHVRAALSQKPVALGDVAYCNGADPALIRALQRARLFPRLAGYAGWNTAGNTIGTAVAHGIARLLGPRTRAAERAHRLFLFERLLDDYAYQSVVRPQAIARAQRLGLSPLNLGGKRLLLQRFAARRMAALSRALWRRNFSGPAPSIRIRLPWPRLFECEVRCSDARRSNAAE